ncbi:hypothetical protein O6P43_019541 [Quillaja saponaria]|uniref:Uncharacterized protein n=1 Tax=Quillaja saponaria TaxID=32244 RepID=A0AAD7PL74_QUISA|nr:hypothetical protein O6P43_019541 [Quillaja saponaria]
MNTSLQLKLLLLSHTETGTSFIVSLLWQISDSIYDVRFLSGRNFIGFDSSFWTTLRFSLTGAFLNLHSCSKLFCFTVFSWFNL